MKKILLIVFILFLYHKNLSANTTFFLDFKYILNESEAGKKAQNFLKNKLEKGFKSLEKKEKDLQEEEKKIIKQKKIISQDEYKKQVTELRNKVNLLKKERNLLLSSVAKQRSKARSELLKNLNPILTNYMSEKKIRLVIDKKNILLGDESLDITKDIILLLNKKLKSIDLS